MNQRDFLIVGAVAAVLAHFSRILRPSRTRPHSPLRLTLVKLDCPNAMGRIGQHVLSPLQRPLRSNPDSQHATGHSSGRESGRPARWRWSSSTRFGLEASQSISVLHARP
ncbi:hypothetical protein FRC08_012578 [Ceratobasidium sp. 394]|nr:hypothetical protein FRC08_012578 [Ceratobasidium sp. 394]